MWLKNSATPILNKTENKKKQHMHAYTIHKCMTHMEVIFKRKKCFPSVMRFIFYIYLHIIFNIYVHLSIYIYNVQHLFTCKAQTYFLSRNRSRAHNFCDSCKAAMPPPHHLHDFQLTIFFFIQSAPHCNVRTICNVCVALLC